MKYLRARSSVILYSGEIFRMTALQKGSAKVSHHNIIEPTRTMVSNIVQRYLFLLLCMTWRCTQATVRFYTTMSSTELSLTLFSSGFSSLLSLLVFFRSNSSHFPLSPFALFLLCSKFFILPFIISFHISLLLLPHSSPSADCRSCQTWAAIVIHTCTNQVSRQSFAWANSTTQRL